MSSESGPSTSSQGSRPRKRKRSESGSKDDKEPELICPVCFELLDEVYSTVCGHSFCYRCITHSISQAPHCPVCKSNLPMQNPIHPNFTLNTVLARHRQQQASAGVQQATTSTRRKFLKLADEADEADIQMMMKTLTEKSKTNKEKEEQCSNTVLKDFLTRCKEHKQKELETVQKQLKVITADLESMEECAVVPTGTSNCVLGTRQQRVHANFEELLQDYLYTRMPSLPVPTGTSSSLMSFNDGLTKYSKYSGWKEVSSLTYGEPHNSCSIVSSIEFDKDAQYFAIAGVTKKIKVFNYDNVLQNIGFQNHYPTMEISCSAKLSSVCFNPYHKVQLASSDYDGCVNIWDAHSGNKIATHNEHSKRVWTVVFNPTEPTLFASGSDDCTVKLWTSTRVQSIYTLEATANVCAVRFHPTQRYFMAYGSADHAIHYVDLRQPQQQVHELKGHRKAVSYVQFISDNEIVSASTDSELKMWDVRNGQCIRTYKGHTNEKNFVGLSVCTDFIACGSEDNSVYVYSKKVSNPMLSYKFRMPTNQLLSDDTDLSNNGGSQQPPNNDNSTDFVSSVCWKKDTTTLLAANSQGHIKVISMC